LFSAFLAVSALLVFSFSSLKSAYLATPFRYENRNGAGAGLSDRPALPKHLKTPKFVRAVYMTSWVAGTENWRAELVGLIEKTELNAVVIDVKDYTGRIAFSVSDSVLEKYGAEENRIRDVKEFINELHEKNIYVIARISVFQDPFFVKKRPDLAVKRRNGGIWKDYKGLTWVDPASKEYWDYIVRVARETEAAGFDELNFDYVRFPSDGNMKDISYPFWDQSISMAEALRQFFEYLDGRLSDLNVPLSVDLFGLTTVHSDDLNIGQVLEYAEPYFDYIAPMVYPSHYPKGYYDYSNPALHPYEIIYDALKTASQRLIAASSTPSKLRPWLQDFDLGAEYSAEMVRKEKQAVYDAGLTSWMLWDPANRYTRKALD
jgi:hypothetical protein